MIELPILEGRCDFALQCKHTRHRGMIVTQRFYDPYPSFAAMVAVICPLLLLPIGSGGYWAKPVLEGQDLEDSENAENTAPLLVSFPSRAQSRQADNVNLRSMMHFHDGSVLLRSIYLLGYWLLDQAHSLVCGPSGYGTAGSGFQRCIIWAIESWGSLLLHCCII